MITLDSIPFKNPYAVGHIVDEQAVVVVPEHGNVKVFNEVGTAIWELVDGRNAIREIIAQVCQAFEVDAETAAEDTLAFIEEILKLGIINMRPE